MPNRTLNTTVTDTGKPDTSKIGGLIRAHRYVADLTQVKLAQYLGKTQATVSEYELGTVLPPLDVLIQISQLFSKLIGRPVSLYDLTGIEALQDAEAKLPKVSDRAMKLDQILGSLDDSDPLKKYLTDIIKAKSESRDGEVTGN